MNNHYWVVSARKVPLEGFAGCSFIHLPRDLHRGGPTLQPLHIWRWGTCCKGPHGRQSLQTLLLSSPAAAFGRAGRQYMLCKPHGLFSRKHLETVAAVLGREKASLCVVGDILSHLALDNLYWLCVGIWRRGQSPQKEERGLRIALHSSEFLIIHTEIDHGRARRAAQCYSTHTAPMRPWVHSPKFKSNFQKKQRDWQDGFLGQVLAIQI